MPALSQIKQPLSLLHLFHSDRGKEFDNQLLDKCFNTFNIQRSLSKKGCQYDNVVAEAIFKSIKTEFVTGEKFMITEDDNKPLRLMLIGTIINGYIRRWVICLRYNLTNGYPLILLFE
ncbi:hypothetical protein [Snodgrassella communis]|uniref:hypothetical protein n=1 Tax=Snodgrassella communis TaxID=2946699 RepID=UPI001EF608A8|nr:hypothetical protein [Snodgrassella communis]